MGPPWMGPARISRVGVPAGGFGPYGPGAARGGRNLWVRLFERY